MMNFSTLHLYYQSKLLRDQNFILDNGYTIQDDSNPLETYLSKLTSITIYNFQHIKNDLNINIKIDLKQNNLEINNSLKDLNYVSIKNEDEYPTYYYFVINKRWVSENTIALELEMDTLNTVKYNIDYTIDKKTFIRRTHLDRFEDDGEGGFIYRIDMRSEDINTVLYKQSQSDLKDVNNPNDVEFALYYHNNGSNETDPIACELVPSTPFKVKSFITENFVINSSIIPSGKTAIVMANYNPHSYGNYSVNKCTRYSYTLNSEYQELQLTLINGLGVPNSAIAFQNDGGVIKVFWANFYPGGMGFSSSINWSLLFTSASLDGNKLTVLDPDNDLRCYQMDNATFNNGNGIDAQDFENIARPEDCNASYTLSASTMQEKSIRSISQIDRTLSTNIKIINCPYCPSQISYTEADGVIELSSNWNVNINDGIITLNDFNSDLVNNVVTDTDNIFKYFTLTSALLGRSIDDITDGDYERFIEDPKLYHSDFYQAKFVYDSFTKVFPLEQIVLRDYVGAPDYEYFHFKFITSKNLQSKFLFLFDYEYRKTTEDYPNVLIATRNNEGVLYNSSYLNYVRTGYNFDLKAKDRDLQVGAIKLGLGMSFDSKINTVTGMASNFIDYAKHVAESEDNMQRKLLSLQMESLSVKNADDYDLLKAYSGNVAKLCTYAVSSEMHDYLTDLFYYYGYKYDRQGIPNVTSRYFFNYLQADLVISATRNINEDIINDIKSKFASGVTFLHLQNTVKLPDYINWQQDKENIETSIVAWNEQ